MTDKFRSLEEDFIAYYNLCIAHTDIEKSYVYKVRYNVYCLEFGFEPADKFDVEEETDEYDHYSTHCLVSHNRRGPAGCLRMVPAEIDGENKRMPIEEVCPESLQHPSILQKFEKQVDRRLICEASRLAVDSSFRRRAGENRSRIGESESVDVKNVEGEYRSFNIVSEAVFLSGIALADVMNRPIMMAMMEPFLPRILRRAGICFEKLGDEIEYHGRRAPYYTDTRNIKATLNASLQGFYEYVYQDIQDKMNKDFSM